MYRLPLPSRPRALISAVQLILVQVYPLPDFLDFQIPPCVPMSTSPALSKAKPYTFPSLIPFPGLMVWSGGETSVHDSPLSVERKAPYCSEPSHRSCVTELYITLNSPPICGLQVAVVVVCPPLLETQVPQLAAEAKNPPKMILPFGAKA